VRDLLYCYERYANAECVYLNTALRTTIPSSYFEEEYDLIIFTTVFISLRWGGFSAYEQVHELLAPLKASKATKVIYPQDEWIHLDVLNKCIKDFDINYVFSVAPSSEWHKIYYDVDRSKVQILPALTGYVEHEVIDYVNTKQSIARTIDIGYRAYKAPAWLGRHGFLKTYIADVFLQEAPKYGFNTDISTEANATIVGDKWYDFLLQCRFFIGLEGGSTVLDIDGAIWNKGIAYQKQFPNATFEETENDIFPGLDGTLNLVAISPRHLECCITKTCQVLIEGDYNGILIPDVHYISVKRDFSNLPEVFAKMSDAALCAKIAERAYVDIIASGKYTYQSFVCELLLKTIGYDNSSGKIDASKWKSLELSYNKRINRGNLRSATIKNIAKQLGLLDTARKVKRLIFER
jgi:hypothetical protein